MQIEYTLFNYIHFNVLRKNKQFSYLKEDQSNRFNHFCFKNTKEFGCLTFSNKNENYSELIFDKKYSNRIY